MTFDWFTLLAQLFNFALLLVLLRIFLYRPLLAAISERETLATSALDDARKMQAEAEVERQALAALRAEEEAERDARRAALAEELERLRQERLDSVAREVERLRATTLEALEHEVDRTLDRLRTSLANIVLDEVRLIMEWLADEELERQAVRRFLDRLRELPEDSRRELAGAAGSEGVRLTTAHPLDEPARAEVRNVVAQVLGVHDVRFEEDERLVLGAVMDAGGKRLDGSAAARLETLGDRFAHALADLRPAERQAAS